MPYVFVYGALMLHKTALKSGVAAHVNDHAICFNHIGINRLEPSFANIEESEGDRAWGVLVDFSEEDWLGIRRRELSYKVIDVTTITLDNKKYLCKTLTLMDRFRSVENPPSARYGKILLEGAKYHNLPDIVLERYESYYKNGHKATLRLGPFLYPLSRMAVIIIRLRARKRRKMKGRTHKNCNNR